MRKAIQTIVILGSIMGGIAHADAISDLQGSVDNLADNIARDVANRWQLKGDFRFRNENIDQDFTATDRNRDRIRVRVGATALVNPTVKAEIQFATTENGDARSTNQTLTDANSHKALDLDLAYVEWSPNAMAKVTLGKMKQPWAKTSSLFVDGDINPEGAAVALNLASLGLFANVYAMDLAERSATVDSKMVGAQAGLRKKVNDDISLLAAAGIFNHNAVKNQAVIQSGAAGGFFGNTTKTVGCATGVTSCLANDFDVVDVLAEVTAKVAGHPVVVFVEYAKNQEAAVLNEALAYGVTLNKASLPGSWEVGYLNQKIEKDALFGQWVDSDFGAGNTDSKGHVVRGAYQVAKNWKVNATYFINETNNDIAVAVTYPTAKSVKDRGYDRLQIDLNYAF